MKKLLTLLFTFVIAFSLAMPVFAQDTGAGSPETTDEEDEEDEGEAKTKKTKKTTDYHSCSHAVTFAPI